MAYTVLNLIMTFDGFVAGPHDEIDWIGVGASPVSEGSSESKTWDFSEFISKVGAIVVGMRSYELGIKQGWFKDQAYGPSPVFVLCKKAPAESSSDADFRFVTDGIEAIYREASEAAGDKWVYLYGGPSVVQQFLNKGLIDELHLTIAPIIIGRGIRLFDNLDQRYIRPEKVSGEVYSNGMIEVKYKVVK